MKHLFSQTMVMVLVFTACTSKSTSTESSQPDPSKPPIAKVVKHEMVEHGNVRTDDYFWMRLTDEQKNAESPDQQTQDVLDYLEAENNYREEITKGQEGLRESLFDEIVGRIKQDDSSVPIKYNGYIYYQRFETGADYPLYCRKKDDETNPEEVMLNVPELASSYAYYQIGAQDVSKDNRILAYAVDTVSRRMYTVYFKNLETGELLPDQLNNVDGGLAWANDNKTLFYTVQDPTTLRTFRVFKHVLGQDQSNDELVYEETDETYNCFVSKTKSEQFIVIGSNETLTSEYRVLNADAPNGEFRIIQPRTVGLEYSVDHYGDHFYIRTNLDAENFKLVKTPVTATTKENWIDVVPHREDVFLNGTELFRDFLVLSERQNGLRHIRMIRWDGSSDEYMEFDDPTYAAYIGSNPDFNTDILRYYYTSLTTPGTQYDFNMKTKERVLLKQQEVLGGKFSPDNYTSERVFATASDGTKVPISLVYRNGMERTGKNPLLLYGYGSYGNSMDAGFSSTRLSLLDRGFIFAIAHIRGGQEMGRHWYEDGKLLMKKNTFTDFIDCGKYLVEENYTSPEHLYCQGGSAGGLLVGAVVNMAPALFNGAIAAVPFVDVVSTMWDESIPLTTSEFNEWGNPKEKEYYDYILSYSPYDNVTAQDYPNMLVTTGYWDSQVQYWEPAKWVAKLRAMKTDDNLLLLYCNMDVGHGGASGRFDRFKETAMIYAFLLGLEGMES